MVLNGNGRIAHHQWTRLGRRFPWADFSTFIIMPNHMHGIMEIRASGRGAGEDFQTHNTEDSPLRPYAGGPQVAPGSLGALVRAYKSAVTWRINALRGYAYPAVWQRNYYEHIIRDEADLRWIAEYIQANPGRWALDELNPGDAAKRGGA